MIVIETCPKCGGDLQHIEFATYPPIPHKRCANCGWSWTGEPEKVVRVPFHEPEPSDILPIKGIDKSKYHGTLDARTGVLKITGYEESQ